MATGQTILTFDNVTLEGEDEKVKAGVALVKAVLALAPVDNTPPNTGKVTLEYPAAPFGLTAESPLDFDKRYVLTISEYVA